MARISIIAVFAICAFNVEANELYEKLNCMIEYLKKADAIEKDYPTFPDGVAKDCDKTIEELTEVSYRSVIDALKIESIEKHEKCILGHLKANKWPENNIKHTVYGSSTTLTTDEKTAKSAEILKSNTEILQNAIKLCTATETSA